MTSQVPVELWHEHIGSPTIAGAVLDRLVYGANRIELKRESMRKLHAAKARLDEAATTPPKLTRLRHALLPGWNQRNPPAGFDRNRWLVSIGIGGCNGKTTHSVFCAFVKKGSRPGVLRDLRPALPWSLYRSTQSPGV